MSEPCSALEEKVVEAALGALDEVVGLVTGLVACDTTARLPGQPAREEEKLQRLLAAHLATIGARPDLWEPAPTGAGTRFLPAGLDFAGRPQLSAVLPGAGGGRSLLLNGHIDAVDVAPREQWLGDPFTVEERDGSLYGRGVSDMKGGIACLAVALETLSRLGVRRHRGGIHRVRRLGELPRHGDADDHGGGPRRPRRDAAAGLARGRRRERHREARAAPERRPGVA